MRCFFWILILTNFYMAYGSGASPHMDTPNVLDKKKFVLPDYYKKYTLSFGNPNAPIKIHKFFSFACPSCLTFHKHHYPLIKKEFIETGLVYWTFVPYVMDVDTLYVMAASAVCDDDLKLKIFESIMENTLSWTEDDNKENIIQILKSCGVSDELILETFEEAKYESVLRESFDFQEGILIDGTPTLFINGEEIPGIPGAKKLSKILTDMLNSRKGETP